MYAPSTMQKYIALYEKNLEKFAQYYNVNTDAKEEKSATPSER